MNSQFSKMKKQALKLQEQLSKAQEEMQNLEVIGSAGNNLVKVTLTGEKNLKKIEIDPVCVDPEDVEGLQDLIIAAFADANTQLTKKSPTSNLLDTLPFGNLPF